ncbi:hypothetical protein VTI28DRAFT_4405 [Corynascus sepedonium]
MPLQNLPSEILIHILSSTDSLSDLRALASTSRRIYSLFKRDKAALIYQALANALGPVIDDALGHDEMELLDPQNPDFFGDPVCDVLAHYTGYLEGRDRPTPCRLSLDQVLRLARSYNVMSELADLYINHTFKLFNLEVAPVCRPANPPALLAPPSRVEWLRVLRAHYRLQMALHLWMGAKCGRKKKFDAERVKKANRSLILLWEPWEVQQIACVGNLYRRFSESIAALINDEPLKREYNYRDVYYSLYKRREMAEKLKMADEAGWYKVLDDLSCFRSGDAKMAGLDGTNSLGARQFMYAVSCMGCIHEPSTGRHQFPVTLCFSGDSVTTVPFAWVDAFDGHYGYNFWNVLPRIERDGQPTYGLLTLLGYAIWDAPRFKALKTARFLWHGETGWARSGTST